MLNTEILNKNNIYNWSQLKNNFNKPDLLLGNGFTLQFSNKFSYKSLFEEFLEKCNQSERVFFESFKTVNFEEILKYLNFGISINEQLGIDTSLVENMRDKLKFGLIKTIKEVHPTYSEINHATIESIAKQLSEFGDIYTTNYDLYLYHILMRTLDIEKKPNDFGFEEYIGYQDYFYRYWDIDAGFTAYMDSSTLDCKKLYYLHGSLCIYKKGYDFWKLNKKKNGKEIELIDLISEEIDAGYFPLFVAEGSSEFKKAMIDENRYLRLCHNTLRSSNQPILVFGNSLGEVDSHILDAIKENHKQIIYCIYIGNRSIESVNAEKNTFAAQFNNVDGCDIQFVDSSTVFNI